MENSMSEPNEKIMVGAAEAAKMLSMGRSTFFNKVSLGLLPQPVRFNKRVVRWRMEDLRAVGRASQPTTASADGAAAGIAPGCKQP